MNRNDPRIVNPLSASNHERTKDNFSTLPQQNNFGKMNLDTWEETNGRIERRRRASRQHECLQGGACIHSETPRGRRTDPHEESIRQQNLDRLMADQGGADQVSIATKDSSRGYRLGCRVADGFNGAIDHIIQNNSKARQNPRGLSQLDGYKRGLVNSLTGNLQKGQGGQGQD